METSRIVMAFAAVCALVVVALLVLPYLIVKFTQPGWRVVKFFILFAVLAAALSLFLPAFYSIPAAFVASFIDYHAKSRRP